MLTATKPAKCKPPKAKKCRQCRASFWPARPLQAVCFNVECAAAEGKVRAARLAKREAKVTNAADRAAREAQKGLRQLLAEAQTAVNAYVRWRDRDTTCICCGKPFEAQKPGGSMDAGHYLARSVAPQHRFNLSNIFGQRKNCNRPGGATRGAFRAGVIARIGREAVEALEADTAVHKWTKEEVRAIRDDYRARLREARKETA